MTDPDAVVLTFGSDLVEPSDLIFESRMTDMDGPTRKGCESTSPTHQSYPHRSKPPSGRKKQKVAGCGNQ